jgi:hypothetical protein
MSLSKGNLGKKEQADRSFQIAHFGFKAAYHEAVERYGDDIVIGMGIGAALAHDIKKYKTKIKDSRAMVANNPHGRQFAIYVLSKDDAQKHETSGVEIKERLKNLPDSHFLSIVYCGDLVRVAEIRKQSVETTHDPDVSFEVTEPIPRGVRQ